MGTLGEKKAFDRLDYIFKFFVVASLLIIGVKLCSDIVIPMAFAAIFSAVLLPLVKKLERRRVNTTLAVGIVLLVATVVVGSFITLMISQVVSLVNDLPNLQARFDQFLNSIRVSLYEDLGITSDRQTEMFSEFMKSISGYLAGLLVTTTHTIVVLVQVPIYIFLLLIYRQKFKRFLLQILPGSGETTWKKDVEKVLQGYLTGLFMVTLIAAFLNSVGLLLLGIDHAIFLGILSGVLTVIPYVGITIGSFLPILMALITKDSAWSAVGVVMVFTVVQFLEGNFISPRITGSKVSINALAAIIALLIGGKVLGIAGMILAIPILGIVKILLYYSTRLKPFIILLEDSPTESPPLAPQPADQAIVREKKKEQEPEVLDPTVSQ